MMAMQVQHRVRSIGARYRWAVPRSAVQASIRCGGEVPHAWPLLGVLVVAHTGDADHTS
jgi:hypothetical protein